MCHNFNKRIVSSFYSHSAAYGEGDHRENVPEINAEQNGNFLRQLFGNNLSDDVGAHFAAVIKSAEHNTPDVFLAISQRLFILFNPYGSLAARRRDHSDFSALFQFLSKHHIHTSNYIHHSGVMSPSFTILFA